MKIVALLSLSLFTHPLMAQAKEVPTSMPAVQMSFSPIVKQASPAVVNIYTQRVVKSREFGVFADPIFRQFFGPDFGYSIPRDRVERSLGSGAIISPNGLVVTCNHVIQGSDHIQIVLPDKREFKGEVIKTDSKSDLALIRIQPGETKLPYLELGSSQQSEVGDIVIAIGNPFGLGQTVTSGIISALNRNVAGVNDYQYFIQTDAAINTGNSGGPLIDMKGRILGINSAIYSKSGGSNGVGFAVPADMVRVMKNALENKTAQGRPWFGVQGTEVNQVIAEALKQPVQGIVVNRIHPESPAQKAGLKAGDVILKIDGREMNEMGALDFAIATKTIGSKSSLTVRRDGELQNLDLPIEAIPNKADRVKITGNNPLAGAEVAKLDLAVAIDHGLDYFDNLRGILILKVDAESTPDSLGFREEDIILKINNQPLSSIDDLTRILRTEKYQWHVQFKRGNEVLALRIRA